MPIKEYIKNIFLIFRIKNIILMESNPDFTDNTRMVFDKLIENGVNNKYEIIWFVKDKNKFKHINIKNVKFVSVYSKCNIIKKIKKIYYNYSARIIIDSNNYIPKVRDKQFRLHLCHGTPLKNAGDYCKEIGNVDYILELSSFFSEKDSELFGKRKECFLDIGFPRNDELFFDSKIDKVFPKYKGNKIIVWLPTYRKHKDSSTYKESSLKYGLPGINSIEDISNVDKTLRENNIIMLIKLHPAQDKKGLEAIVTSNIKVITDDELIENNLNLYKLLAVSDALITDYSSVYYDYLLTQKPIALSISDISEYEENVGFVYNYYDTVKGDYIYSTEELCVFISNLANNIDKKREERLKSMKLYHTFCDNKSSERVYEFIKKYL